MLKLFPDRKHFVFAQNLIFYRFAVLKWDVNYHLRGETHAFRPGTVGMDRRNNSTRDHFDHIIQSLTSNSLYYVRFSVWLLMYCLKSFCMLGN